MAPRDAEMWHALGVVHAGHDARVSQHAFIRALQLDSKAYYAWDSLGALYLAHGRGALAEKAFEQSQRVNPESQGAWCGLAQCYERAALAPCLSEDLQKMVDDGVLTLAEATVRPPRPSCRFRVFGDPKIDSPESPVGAWQRRRVQRTVSTARPYAGHDAAAGGRRAGGRDH